MVAMANRTKLSPALIRRMTVAFTMGFSSGLPFLLLRDLLKAWLSDVGADLTIIGFTSLVSLPYNFKFIWAPLLDRVSLPFMGRRRGWLIVIQLCLAATIAGIAFAIPQYNADEFAEAAKSNMDLVPWLVVYACVAMAFCAASQDIVIDAYRREDLPDEELGLGSSLAVNGYRVGMLVAGSGGLILADQLGSYVTTYLIMAGCMAVGVITTLLTPEPEITSSPSPGLKEAVLAPFLEYFARPGAILMLSFIFFYKVGDSLAASMLMPFYLDLGFTKTQVGLIGKIWGFWATIGGGALGGIMLVWLGIGRGLWVFGFLQMISTAGFALLATVGNSLYMLTGVIAFENLASGMGTAAFVGFMASQTNKRFTGTQYALLTSFMAVPRDVASAPAGWLAKVMGWEGFFIFCTLLAIPGMLLLFKMAPWSKGLETAEAKETAGLKITLNISPMAFAGATAIGAVAGCAVYYLLGPWLDLYWRNAMVLGLFIGLGTVVLSAKLAAGHELFMGLFGAFSLGAACFVAINMLLTDQLGLEPFTSTVAGLLIGLVVTMYGISRQLKKNRNRRSKS
jgi:PAT family beta-lactamase induction signal transducer AmpG